MHPQTGGAASFYTQHALPSRLARYLRGRRSAECEIELHRLTNWEYDDKSPHDDNTTRRLRSCLVDIEAGIARRQDKAATESMVMASNLLRSFDMQSGAGVRDAAMYENFLWFKSRLPRGAKILIWCATVHARISRVGSTGAVTPLGTYIHESMGSRAATIGFSALSGSYGMRGQSPVKLAPAAPDSLESRAFAHEGSVRYINSRQLHAYGNIAAKAITYDKSESMDWGDVVDGLIVLRQENPPHYVHGAQPRQALGTSP